MKQKTHLFSLLGGALLLQACGGSMLGSSDADDHKLIPDVVVEDPTKPRPSASAPVIKINDSNLLAAGSTEYYVLPVGVTLDYGSDAAARYGAIEEVAKVAAGSVRLIITPETSPQSLEAALIKALSENLLVNLTLHDDNLYCKDNAELLSKSVKENWLGKFLPIIAQDRFQPILLLSIARGWGPTQAFNPASSGYREYIDYNKTLIREFRRHGFKLPLVIEAPGCGEDYHVFDSNRVRELLAADTEKNLVFGLAAKGKTYNTVTKIMRAANLIRSQRAPVLFTEVGGSEVIDGGVKEKAFLAAAYGNAALSISPEWQGPGDKIGYLFPFAEPQNIKNTQLSVDINFAEAYINAEYLAVVGANAMGFQVYLRDASGNYASIKWHSVKDADVGKAGWQTLSYKIGANMPNTGWVQDGFDMTQVVSIGVELVAQDKPASVTGAILLDNLKLAEGTGPAIIYASDFSAGADGWKNSQWEGKTAAIATADGGAGKAISLVPQNDQFEITRTGLNVDLTQPFTITARIYIPASMTAYGMGIFAANATKWAGGGWGGTWNLKPGEWNDYSYTPSDVKPPPAKPGDAPGLSEAEQFAASGGNSLGFQFSGFKVDEINGDAILIENIQIVSAAGASAVTEMGVQYSANFSADVDGWKNIGWADSPAANLAVEDNALSIVTATNGSNRITIDKGGLTNIENLNLDGDYKVTVTLFVPESLKDKAFNFQVFFQDVNWGNHNAPINLEGDEIVYGEWHSYSVDAEFPEGFDTSGKPKYIGIDMLATSFDANDKVLISGFVLEGPVPVEVEEVLLGTVDFNREQQVRVDFVDGAITAEQALKLSPEVLSAPFGWFAHTWYAARTVEAGYDLVTNMADAESLTERGELIVNTPGGLAEMRSLLVPDEPEVVPAAQ